LCDIRRVWAILVSMFPSFPHYKEGTGGRWQIEPGPPVVDIQLYQHEWKLGKREIMWKHDPHNLEFSQFPRVLI
jgi:hypothetical protein